MKEHEWLFIMGMVRTGTTLMTRLLTLHPECWITAECGWPLNILWGMTLPPAGYTRATWDGGGNCEWRLPRLATVDDAHEITRAMCGGYVERLHPEARVCGDKAPYYGMPHPDGSGRRFWHDLRDLWPDCKLLVMHRDFGAVVESAMRTWPGRHTEGRLAQEAQLRAEGHALIPDPYNVQLEELEASPREVMRGVLEWANLPAEAYPWERFDEHFEPGHRVN